MKTIVLEDEPSSVAQITRGGEEQETDACWGTEAEPDKRRVRALYSLEELAVPQIISCDKEDGDGDALAETYRRPPTTCRALRVKSLATQIVPM